MAEIEIYYISRMSREKNSDPGKHSDRNGNIMVSPEKKLESWAIIKRSEPFNAFSPSIPMQQSTISYQPFKPTALYHKLKS